MVYNQIQQGPSSALLAALSAIATHYVEEKPGLRLSLNSRYPDISHAPNHFYKLACTITKEQLDQCGDGKPPLALLQALVLITFYEMIVSARGRAWRSLGTCVRVAHELDLHLADSLLQGKSKLEENAWTESWSRKEEQRRAWWLLWELDVFASTVRRRPASIHDGEYAVLLPVNEKSWYEGHYQPSCFLDPDPLHRTRKLLESGNTNGEAWYIVINSLLRDAHTTANPTSHCDRERPRLDVSPLLDSGCGNPVDERKLAVLDDFILYFKTMLPKELSYQGNYLSFCPSSDSYGEATAIEDCHKQLIHAMIHLGRLMILHHYCIRNTGSSVLKGKKLSAYLSLSGPSVTQKLRAILGFTEDQTAWEKYLEAAEEIIRVVRKASPNHIAYGHPLLASTFWIAAATQLFKKAFAQDEAERDLAQSNFDLLRLTLDHSHKFWTTSELMVKNIDTLASRLGELRVRLVESQGDGADALGCLDGADLCSFDASPFDDPNGVEQERATRRDGASVTTTAGLGNLSMPNNIDYTQTCTSQIPAATTVSDDKPSELELQAFMYDFCGDNWDFWSQDLADLFPGCSQT
ncbi:fungal specific transcription factor [Fonsecaea pedrosoi]|nr:fungal specific transcription factor [Fonsecaea pedrosoi]